MGEQGEVIRAAINSYIPSLRKYFNVEAAKPEDIDFPEFVKLYDEHVYNSCKEGQHDCLYKFAEEGNIRAIRTILNKVDPGWELDTNIFNALKPAVRNGYFDIVVALVKKLDPDLDVGMKEEEFSNLLYIAAYTNNIKIINYFIEQGAGLYAGLVGAAEGNHHDLMDYFFSKIDDKYNGWQSVLNGAASGGHLDLVKQALKVLTKVQNKETLFDIKSILNHSLVNASKLGHLDVVKFLIEHGATDPFNAGLIHAAKAGHLDVVKFLLETDPQDINKALGAAASSGHKDIIDYLIEKGANDWTSALDKAAEGGHANLVRFFYAKGGIPTPKVRAKYNL